ncbi:hypothetical protein F5Y09DRAFT_357082 [Xylaria sp. FL1042]|nr:hypothetical protein F5Y09DRAFT_357082 [Xylaria sp. FL1042]
MSSSSNNLAADVHQDCSQRYKRHQKKLLLPRRTTKPTPTPSSHKEQSLPLRTMKTPILPPQPSYPQIGKKERQVTSETAVTEIDDICHDCWQRELQLAKQRDDDSNSSTTTRDGEEQEENMDNTHVLREMSMNELILLQPSVSLEAMSSAESATEE